MRSHNLYCNIIVSRVRVRPHTRVGRVPRGRHGLGRCSRPGTRSRTSLAQRQQRQQQKGVCNTRSPVALVQTTSRGPSPALRNGGSRSTSSSYHGAQLALPRLLALSHWHHRSHSGSYGRGRTPGGTSGHPSALGLRIGGSMWHLPPQSLARAGYPCRCSGCRGVRQAVHAVGGFNSERQCH